MPRSALITGSTGYIGIQVFSNLLRQKTIDRIICVSRHNDQEAFWSSIQSQAKKFQVSLNISEAKEKVEVVRIDLDKNHGLILPALEKYKQSVSTVHHLACDSTYGHPFEHFEPWINCTKALIQYCMDPKYPKQMYATGSYGHHLIDNPHVDLKEDFYFINGYFQYKRWLNNYMQEKMDEGLNGILFEPAYIIGPIDPGQDYILWRIARMFVALGYAFKYPMGVTPVEMMIDNYMLTVNHPDTGLKVMSPGIPKPIYVHEAIQKLVPDLKIIDYQEFRNIIKQVMPKRLKYFGPNVPLVVETTKGTAIFHPLYDNTRFEKGDLTDYLLNCAGLKEAVKLGLEDRQKLFKMRSQAAN
ncbi:unnamed protein product [Adineta steineri]|uniref:Thioester reductase (TE) domain-containing protein n=1 Tax=Adineta steineri TaxID=433720 RepID=A0A814DBG2_9BILA|nr:unnamed protein product [Adineta steineri]CAF1191420.1 unnamed protein product [Adineta steineri]CAF1191853.1 unnamed protein product [Adineta steineri]CAF1300278.1 unnamed protein product [Adineta steineri]